jgi:hypothetical protein
MVFLLTHSQVILQYKENGGRIEPYTIVIMRSTKNNNNNNNKVDIRATLYITGNGNYQYINTNSTSWGH